MIIFLVGYYLPTSQGFYETHNVHRLPGEQVLRFE